MINDQRQFIGRRGELLAELFLQDLRPRFVARADTLDVGVDFFVGFSNTRGGVNLVAVEVKATEQLSKARIGLARKHYTLLANSNVPGLILVVDVKQSKYYFAFADNANMLDSRETIWVQLLEADEDGRSALLKQLSE